MGEFFSYIMKWWIFSVIIGIIAMPISYMLFRKSHDRGYMFSKIIGIFLIGYFSWLIGFISFSMATIYIVILAMLGVSTYIFIKNKSEILEFLGEKMGLIMVAEIFYLFVFLVYALFRMYQPDIIGTEKFMDFAFMNSITKATTMPPYDPWMYGVDEAGKSLFISYYYFGYVIMAIMFKLTGIPNGSAYNLAITYTVALSAMGIVGLLFNMTKNYLIGFLGAAFLLVISNIDGFMQVVSNGWTSNGLNWWHTSRIIDYPQYDITINEFPFFSFLLGDLHPHQMAIPFVLLALNGAFSFIKTEDKLLVEKNLQKISILVFTGLVLGGLWFMNSWDLPTYFFVTALCIAGYKYSRFDKVADWMKDAGIALGIILTVAIVAYLPFTLLFGSQAKGIGWVKANTKITDYLIIFGVMLFPILSFLIFRTANWLYALKLQGVAGEKAKKRLDYCPRCGKEIREGKVICGQCGYQISGDELHLGGENLPVKKANKTAVSFFKFLLEPATHKDKKVYLYSGVALAMAVGFVIFKSVIDAPKIGAFIGVMFVLMSFVFLLGMTKVEQKENQFALILIFTAFFASFGCDFLHVIDTFSREEQHVPLERMNTVFKFYYQTWIMYSIAAAYGFFWIKHFYLRFKPAVLRWSWYSVFIILIFMGLFYPVAASKVKTGAFVNGLHLDGSTFLKYRAYEGRMPAIGDYQAINWLKDNVKGHPVILEAWGGEYTEYARVSSFTGLPTVVGWPGHELQWRGSGDEAARRQSATNRIYETNDIEEAKRIMQKYKVEFVYVGVLEKDKYAAGNFDKFAQFMDVAYANKKDTTIYKIRK